MDALWLAVVVGGLGCIWLLCRRWFTFSKLPPGPRGWPLVGNDFQQDPILPQITWSKWAEEYGEVFTLYHFDTPLVLCNSFEAIWEMFVSKSNDFAGRPIRCPYQYVSDNGSDVIMSDFNPHLAARKKILTTGIKMYGDGLERLETIMMDIITDLGEDFQKSEQQPFDPFKPLQLALCNTLALLLLGDKFDYTDQDFRQLLDHIEDFDHITAPSLQFLLLDTFPWLHNLPFTYCKVMDRFVNGCLRDWIPLMIQKRMVHYDKASLSCILDAFIKQHETDMETKPHHPLDKGQMNLLCANIFVAGMLTSTSTMYTLLAILTVEQDVQTKLRAEVDQVLGGRRAKLQDKQTMPYYLAVLEEVLRYAVIASGLPHKAMVDSSICGHFIPKGTPECIRKTDT